MGPGGGVSGLGDHLLDLVPALREGPDYRLGHALDLRPAVVGHTPADAQRLAQGMAQVSLVEEAGRAGVVVEVPTVDGLPLALGGAGQVGDDDVGVQQGIAARLVRWSKAAATSPSVSMRPRSLLPLRPWNTPIEALERAFRCECCATGSGREATGAGLSPGGEGIERDLLMLEDLTVSLIAHGVGQPWASPVSRAPLENWLFPSGDKAGAGPLADKCTAGEVRPSGSGAGRRGIGGHRLAGPTFPCSVDAEGLSDAPDGSKRDARTALSLPDKLAIQKKIK